MASLVSAAATTISISWSIPSGSVVDSYDVTWQRDTLVGCSDEDQATTTISGGSTGYVITGLEEDSSYIITLRAFNAAGSSEDTINAMTQEAGEIILWHFLACSATFEHIIAKGVYRHDLACITGFIHCEYLNIATLDIRNLWSLISVMILCACFLPL